MTQAYILSSFIYKPGYPIQNPTALFVWKTPIEVWAYIDNHPRLTDNQKCFEVRLPKPFDQCVEPWSTPRPPQPGEAAYGIKWLLIASVEIIREVPRNHSESVMAWCLNNEPSALLIAMLAEARRGDCARDCRAAALVRPDSGTILAIRRNGAPGTGRCGRDAACEAACARACMHAEARAIDSVGPHLRRGAELVHARLDPDIDGLAASREPRCLDCARFVLDTGVAAVWLHHAEGWRRWPAQEFFDASAAAALAAPFGMPGERFAVRRRGSRIEIRSSGDRIVLDPAMQDRVYDVLCSMHEDEP